MVGSVEWVALVRQRIRTLWRVPITGGAPVSTGLAMEALRDISMHPDGRQIAFNARFKRSNTG